MKPAFGLWAVVAVLAAPGASEATCDYGPDTCLPGYVWREAFAGDHVCVTGATRDQAARDNALASQRRSPGGGPYGPDTCLQGYVWREASPADHVCVTGEVRAQAAADNAQAEARRDPQCAAVPNQGDANLEIVPRWNANGDLVVEVSNWSKLPGSVDTLTARLPGDPGQPCEWSVTQRLVLGPTATQVVVLADRAAVARCLSSRIAMQPDRLREIRFARIRDDRQEPPTARAEALTIEAQARDGGQASKRTTLWSLTRRVQ